MKLNILPSSSDGMLNVRNDFRFLFSYMPKRAEICRTWTDESCAVYALDFWIELESQTRKWNASDDASCFHLIRDMFECYPVLWFEMLFPFIKLGWNILVRPYAPKSLSFKEVFNRRKMSFFHLTLTAKCSMESQRKKVSHSNLASIKKASFWW